MTSSRPDLPDTLPHPSHDPKLRGLRLWAVETRPVNRAVMTATMERHIRYQLELEAKGILFAAGPIFAADAAGPDGTGLIVLRAGSEEEARAIAEADPMHAAGGRDFVLRQWLVNEGSIDLRVPLSRYNYPIVA